MLRHELARGFGFRSLASTSTGAFRQGRKDAYSTFLLDLTTGKHWPEMTDAERLASMTNTRRVVFAGPSTTAPEVEKVASLGATS